MGKPEALYFVRTHSPSRVPSWSPVKTFQAPLRDPSASCRILRKESVLGLFSGAEAIWGREGWRGRWSGG